MVEIHPSNAGDAGSIPGWGTKIPGAIGDSADIKKKKNKMGHRVIFSSWLCNCPPEQCLLGAKILL